jgi:hypothetical protein
MRSVFEMKVSVQEATEAGIAVYSIEGHSRDCWWITVNDSLIDGTFATHDKGPLRAEPRNENSYRLLTGEGFLGPGEELGSTSKDLVWYP